MTSRISIAHRIALGTLASAFTAALIGFAPVAPAFAKVDTTANQAKLPAEIQAGGVRYMSGGVTYEEADLFKAHLHDYPLAIELVEKPKAGTRDWYTADARVVITTQAGEKMLDAHAQGPFMLVRLDPGTYEVDAMLGKQTLQKKHVVVLNDHTARATFIFPAGTN